ncbi:MAG: peptide/nickel transport system substrate-binding protein [Chloroflexota bacterium]|nr:peptide/nickel transport system substrate-binding protein [Chloroflexota bacterium]
MRARTFVPCLLAVVWVLAGCAPAAQNTPAPVGGSAPPAQARQSKTLTIALQGEPAALNVLMGGDIGGSPGGQVSLALNERLSTFDNKGIPFAQLATELPSLDKGTWVLNQDGTMQTTYHLRPNVKWHDGQPMTARDIVFGWTVARDTELPVATRDVATLITTIDTPDDATLVMHWSRPYPQAHVLGEIEMAPMPAHLLQETYAADKDKFQRLPYWTTEFVGVGPYRLEKWELGDRFVLKAFDGYYGTHPKIDTLNFVFIGDEAATIAQLFSGAIDGEIRGLQPKSVLQAKRQWEQTGKKPYVSLESVGTRADEVQYRDPKARELTDLRVRRGLLMAIDRQTLGDAVFDTTAPQADGLVPLDDPRYGWMKDSLTSYPYDQRRALQELAAGGWQRGPDGAMVNAAGERVTLSLWTTEGAQWQETQAINADAWRAIGFAVDEFVLPTARARDRELNASFPSFNGAFYGLNYFQPVRIYQSGECASADNRWTGTNRGCYQNPELDRIAQPLVTAVDPAQQQRLWSEFARVFSDQLPALPLYHMPWANMFREGVTGPKGESWRGSGSSGTWNVTEWDIQ